RPLARGPQARTTNKEGKLESSAAVAAGAYPVQVEIPKPAKSSRLLLLLRFILIIPSLLFAMVLITVGLVLTVINYIVVLITGHAVFVGFLSGTVRYLTRMNAYWYFLVDKYPPFTLGEAPDYPAHVLVAPPGHIHRWRIFSYILALPHILILYGLSVLVSFTTLVAFVVVLIFGR